MIATKDKGKPLHKQWLIHHKLFCEERRSPLMTRDLRSVYTVAGHMPDQTLQTH